MLKVRVEKRGIRALGVAESFRKGLSRRSVLGGVVMRSDLVVDGFVFGSATIEGEDATDAIIDMFRRLNRSDVNVIMLGGGVISLYNIIDVDKVVKETDTPTICVTFEESEGLEEHIKRHFPRSWKPKLEAYRRLGGRERVILKTGYRVFVRASGLSFAEAKRALDKFTLQGSVPEPIRLARLVARAGLELHPAALSP